MKRLFDLRFVIGVFFLVVGLLLLGYGLLFSAGDATAVNASCGALFTLFGVIMVLLSFRKPLS